MQLLETKNYSLFSLCAFNRDIGNTKYLEESMKKFGFIKAYPLHVVKNGTKLEIKAGHHRFVVAKKLGLSIPYVICTDNAPIQSLEAGSRDWSLDDYLTSYCKLGDPDYLAVQEYKERTGIQVSTCIAILSGMVSCGGFIMKAFKEGSFHVTDNLSKANQIAELVKILSDANLKWATKSCCVLTLTRIIMAGQVDYDRFKKRIKANLGILSDKGISDSYMEMWESIYNRSSKDKIAVVLLTNKALAERREKAFEIARSIAASKKCIADSNKFIEEYDKRHKDNKPISKMGIPAQLALKKSMRSLDAK